MSRHDRNINYVGQKYGLVTVVSIASNRRLLCECSCGALKYLFAANIVTNPPKTHRTCTTQLQYELPL